MCVSIIRATQTNRKHAAGCDRVSGSPEFNHQSSTSMPGTSEMRRDSLWKYLSRDTPKFLLGFPIVLTVLILFFLFGFSFSWPAFSLSSCCHAILMVGGATKCRNGGATNTNCRPGNISTRLVKISLEWAQCGWEVVALVPRLFMFAFRFELMTGSDVIFQGGWSFIWVVVGKEGEGFGCDNVLDDVILYKQDCFKDLTCVMRKYNNRQLLFDKSKSKLIFSVPGALPFIF